MRISDGSKKIKDFTKWYLDNLIESTNKIYEMDSDKFNHHQI